MESLDSSIPRLDLQHSTSHDSKIPYS